MGSPSEVTRWRGVVATRPVRVIVSVIVRAFLFCLNGADSWRWTFVRAAIGSRGHRDSSGTRVRDHRAGNRVAGLRRVGDHLSKPDLQQRDTGPGETLWRQLRQ